MVWLSISLFSSKKNWNKILTNCIRQLVENNQLIIHHRIEFNYLCGENLRLSLLTEDEMAAQLSEFVHVYVNTYFNNAELPLPERKLPVNGIFMPFPANSIQFGLYPPEIITIDELENYSYAIGLSEVMISALKDEIDDEMIATFAFYVQLAMVKAISIIVKHVGECLFIISFSNNTYYENEGNAILSSTDTLNEITLEVLKGDVFDGELQWLNQWIGYFNTSLNILNYRPIDKSEVITNHYQTSVIKMYNQLGINDYGRETVSQWVSNSVRDYFIKSDTR